MPEGKIVIHVQYKRYADFSTDTGYTLQLNQLLIFIIIQVWQLIPVDLTGYRTLTFITCDVLSAIRKGVYRQVAVIGTQGTVEGLGRVRKVLHCLPAQNG